MRCVFSKISDIWVGESATVFHSYGNPDIHRSSCTIMFSELWQPYLISVWSDVMPLLCALKAQFRQDSIP